MAEHQERQPLLAPDGNTNGSAGQKIVCFGEHDADNPQEWSKDYRWFSVGLLCMFAATVTYTCVGIVPVAGDVVKELKGYKDPTTAVLFVTIWELGEATGPLFIAPLSEMYGRFVVYNVANCLFITGVVLTALSQSIGLLIFSRFATGCAVAANVLNPAIIADMFPSQSRGAAMSVVTLAPLIGGALGYNTFLRRSLADSSHRPTVSGYLAEATGWRTITWLCAAVAAVVELACLTMFRETYHPTILKRRARRKREETSDDAYRTEFDDASKSVLFSLAKSMFRPVRIIWSSTMLQCLSLWGGVMFSFFYVNSTALPEILDVVYGFGPTKRGLSYLAWSLGSVISIFTCHRSMDRIYNALGKRHGAFYPEGRLPLVIIGGFLLPLAVTLYGWTAQLHTNVFVFLSTVTLLCVSVVFSIIPLMTFITDAFGNFSASAMTAVLLTRCVLSALLPLTVPPMAQSVGNGWAFTILALVALSFSPIPCLVMRYGPTWRQGSEFTRDA